MVLDELQTLFWHEAWHSDALVAIEQVVQHDDDQSLNVEEGEHSERSTTFWHQHSIFIVAEHIQLGHDVAVSQHDAFRETSGAT